MNLSLLLPMIVFVRHAFVDSTIGFDVHKVANLVSGHIRKIEESKGTFESTLEHLARTRAITVRVRHLCHFIVETE